MNFRNADTGGLSATDATVVFSAHRILVPEDSPSAEQFRYLALECEYIIREIRVMMANGVNLCEIGMVCFPLLREIHGEAGKVIQAWKTKRIPDTRRYANLKKKRTQHEVRASSTIDAMLVLLEQDRAVLLEWSSKSQEFLLRAPLHGDTDDCSGSQCFNIEDFAFDCAWKAA